MNRIASIIGTLTAVAFLGCGGEPGALPASSEPVDVVASTSAAATSLTAAPATVVATRQAALATRISGTIRSVAVDIGAEVQEGEALVRLDTRDIEARVSSAEAAAQLARQSYERIAALAQDGAATAQELDDARARLEMARAGLREARAQLNYVLLRAPFDGVITARMADPGDLAVPGRPVLEMIGTGALKIEADLPGELAGRIAVGDALDVYLPETGSRYTARVTRVVPAVERSSRRFRIEARFATESEALSRLAPGAFARIELDEPGATTRWIPADAVVTRGQLTGVYVVEGDELRLRWIRLGQRYGDTVEMLAGPGPDALIVRRPAAALVDGQPVGEVQQVAWQPPFVGTRTASTEGDR
ncbi:MAG: efflux RND transporter periplasmic adaptor subunit [Gemmatimonadetes bacterium]|uniref:Efflux RND transporter periplasmic adaptor subunit n=1 Tax=Candidatus Kutchimonas denitrificans TaxID=3056748 RepID=A0AAE5C7P9_9BACT|nr:efflux RND transporter periplasmic adaptor subunit [Gemmatimonadota bacterium]NIR73681.1 efflux RND transporter periplasmic adaptor subunit [Candidatus Kutchimonas denitrificans]NIS00731.1 efflux RND transporter periplasmic adaptor subunit [Gemmatimonadota bacterium]NIT66318.1 efflux RND transporter periplasmic adaptor subunit [Gemmatimonadota bacterium]NIU51536.1 efflux RND transporter periplasmic adaptor subunit [Gemmatimonadota bacterium]